MIRCVDHAAVVDRGKDIFDRLGDPQRRNAQIAKIVIVDFVDQTLPVAATIQLQVTTSGIVGSSGRIVGRIAVQEPVCKDLIDNICTKVLLVGNRGICIGIDGRSRQIGKCAPCK
ncbi:hypothetical protein D3C76_1250470 [compost metagenome]